ncbi:MAG: outer membrane beta-barrel domain-containing protein [Deltaproteobacteria bacterium]|nr:outer membrane beta-barrel domain-containing protein [Deltaproteobacteria bacterium]
MLTLFATLALAADGVGKDTLDIGVLKNAEVKVVQKQLFQKEDKLEIGAALGVMPFDGYTIAPQLALAGAQHFSETTAIELRVGGGYGLPNAVYTELEGPSYGVAVEAYRYLGSVEADLQYTPIYAKMNLGGKRVLHHDVYVLLGAGATVEQSLLPEANIAIAPTVPIGVGARLFTSKKAMVRLELRDSMLLEYRAQSQTWGFKQNVALSAGLSMLLGETK